MTIAELAMQLQRAAKSRAKARMSAKWCSLYSATLYTTNADAYADLFFHGDSEEYDEVEDENRPEDRDVEEIKQSTRHANHQSLQRTVPDIHTGTPSHC